MTNQEQQPLQTVSRLIDDPEETVAYDYGVGAPGAVLSTTKKRYLDYTASTVRILGLPTSTVVYDALQAFKSKFEYDTAALQSAAAVQYTDPGDVPRGNLTSVKHCADITASTDPDTCTHWITSSYGYDKTGNLVSLTDARSNTTTFDWTDQWDESTCSPSAGAANAYVTTITNPLGQSTTASYRSCSGQRSKITDPNQQVTSYKFDELNRVKEAHLPDTGGEILDYDDAQRTVTFTTAMGGSQSIVHRVTYDGIGRYTQTEIVSDPQGTDTTTFKYDGLDRLSFQSNPTRQGTPVVGQTFTYDALGRQTLLTQPDDNSAATDYKDFPCVRNTDEASKARVSCSDALGRLVSVQEDPDGLNYLTSYQYTAAGSLAKVSQAGLADRSFTYDSMSRLITATNPETGTICYGQWNAAGECVGGYDGNGNLLAKTDARLVTTNYTYDALNRLTDKTYTIPLVNNVPVAAATPSVHYQYDAIPQGGALNAVGRLTGETLQQGSSLVYQRTIPAYDPMGRIATDTRCVPGYCDQPHSVTYVYDLAGHETQATVDGSVFVYNYDGAGRPNAEGLHDTSGNQSYVLMTDVQYDPFGNILSSDGFETRTYDVRGRPSTVAYGSGLNYTAAYDYTPSGNLLHANDSVNGNWTYGYDNLNRLTSATSTDPRVGAQSYSYDSFGNKLTQTGVLSHSATFSTGNNRADCPGCYDAAGNLLRDVQAMFPHSYSYDAEGRLSGVTDLGYQYVYDGAGERIAALQNGAYTKGYFHEAHGQFYTVYDETGTETAIEIFGAGRHIFTLTDDFYLPMLDGQGTERSRYGFFTGVQENCSNLPFGDGMNCDNPDPSPLHFTGKQRDPESGLDFFGARYYASNAGRWMSPDWADKPEAVPYADLANPQSLNLYGYVKNNPLSQADPDGHCCDINDVGNFVTGASTAFVSDNTLGAVRQPDINNSSYQFGSALGHAAATVQGVAEALGGAGVEAGGFALDATGVGALVGVPANVAGAGMMLHGGGTAATGFTQLFSKRTGDFTKGEKNAMDSKNAADNGGVNKCTNCGQEVQKVQNKAGEPTPGNQLQRHHDPQLSKRPPGTKSPNDRILCKDCHVQEHKNN